MVSVEWDSTNVALILSTSDYSSERVTIMTDSEWVKCFFPDEWDLFWRLGLALPWTFASLSVTHKTLKIPRMNKLSYVVESQTQQCSFVKILVRNDGFLTQELRMVEILILGDIEALVVGPEAGEILQRGLLACAVDSGQVEDITLSRHTCEV